MTVEVTKKEYNKEIHFVISTGNTCEPIEQQVIESCLDKLNLDNIWNQKQTLKNVVKELKQAIITKH